MSDELLPCPFCGYVGLDFGEGSTFRWITAECGGCGASTGETRIQTFGEGTREEWMADAKADAIASWNRRAPLHAVDAPVGGEQAADEYLTPERIQKLATHHPSGLVRALARAASTSPSAPGMASVDAAEDAQPAKRVATFIDRYAKMRGLHPEELYAIADEQGNPIALRVSDLRALVAPLPAPYCGESLLSVVASLYKARTRISEMEADVSDAIDNWQQYATERESTAQQVIERHRREIGNCLQLLARSGK